MERIEMQIVCFDAVTRPLRTFGFFGTGRVGEDRS
jgi:hypothetical protein